jgi:major membrane immunogen (membrane-anchored lipoprotein)
MKKTAITLMAGCALLLTSCGTGDNEVKQNITYTTVNLITDNATGEAVATSGAYTFQLVTKDLYDRTMAVGTSKLTYNNRDHSFTTDPVEFKEIINDNAIQQCITGLEGLVDNTTPLKDCRIMITGYPKMPGDFNITKAFTPSYTNDKGQQLYIPGVIIHPNIGTNIYPMVVVSYGVGDAYTVRSFTTDAFYKGNTATSYKTQGGEAGSYTTDNIIYRVIMDVENKKAGLVMYNAKFTSLPQEPAKTALYLAGLDVKFVSGGYEISGTDIVPQLPGSEGMLPMDDYTFNSITLRTTDTWLNTVSIDYKVSGKMGETVIPELYTGRFTGSYVSIPDTMKQ